MKTYLTILFTILVTILLLLNSCKGDPATATYNTIINNSNHEIKILVDFDYQIYDSIMIPIKNHKEYSTIKRGGSTGIGVFVGDSVIVVFDDSISITHYSQNPQDISRNLYYEENWPGGEVDEYEYRYEYIFTDADYQEALDKM